MNLHGQIMNLPIEHEGRSIAREAVTDSGGIHIAYKLGHRDARHQAAELSIQADTVMDDMAKALESAKYCNYGDPIECREVENEIAKALEKYQKLLSGEYCEKTE